MRSRLNTTVIPALVVAALWFGAPAGVPAAAFQAPADGLTVLSLNLAMREDVYRIAAEVTDIGADAADVMLLQEVVARPGEPSVAHRLGEQFGMHAVFEPSFTRADGVVVGLATLGRYPVQESRVLPLKRFELSFRSRERVALAVRMGTEAGPLTTYNVHLDTRINSGDRVDQVSGVVTDAAQHDGTVVIAGDFNTNGNYWLFHTLPLPFIGRQGKGLERYMADHGLTSAFTDGSTHDALRMRLDWVFLKGREVSARAIHPVEFSDHHALVVSMQSRPTP